MTRSASEKLSAADDAYYRLREMIVTGQLQPGQTLREKDLIRLLGSGRTPIREAVQRLATQHVLAVFPRRGIAVAKLSMNEVQAIFEMRETIEARTAELAAIRRSENEKREIQAIGEELLVISTEDFNAFLEADQRLHHLIAHAAHNKFFAESADHLLMLSDWVWHQYFLVQGSNPSDYFDHRSIIQAIVERDAECAAAMMHKHVQQSREVIRNAM